MKPGPIVAFVILVAASVFTFVSFSGATARHVSVGEAMRSRGETVQVPGRVDHGSTTYRLNGTQGVLSFDVTDLQGGRERMRVVYAGAKPENFANATSVEAIGVFRDGEFHAHRLLVKCPSRYQAKEERQRDDDDARIRALGAMPHDPSDPSARSNRSDHGPYTAREPAQRD
ncbi:MAG: cytochrome c maturation protein CcmE [Armatimonadetes bacterium]|nr:cytochrome c maturation protein CcmE [Armatimonadota bacterium]